MIRPHVACQVKANFYFMEAKKEQQGEHYITYSVTYVHSLLYVSQKNI